MRSIVAFSILMAAATTGCCAQGDVKEFPAAGIKQILADTGSGPITAEAGANDSIRVEVTDNDPAKCLITLKADGAGFIIKAENKPAAGTAKMGFWKRLFSGGSMRTEGCSAGFIIKAPSAVWLKAYTGSGPIKVKGLTGGAKLDTGSGRISLNDLGGDVLAKTGSGSISGSLCAGNLKAETGSGRIDLGGLCGPVTANTGSGSISLLWQKTSVSGAARADSGSGSITITFPPETSISAKLDTGSGKARNEFFDGGIFKVSAETGSGDISILKAK